MGKHVLKNDNTIDLLKLLFSVLIVALHTHIPYYISNGRIRFYLVSITFRLAVPFFFVVSGYYLGKKVWVTEDCENRYNILADYVKRLFPPYLFWGTVNFILEYIGGGYTENFALSYIKSMLFYPRGAMWFVEACIVGACVIMLLFSHKKGMCILAIVFYFFALLGNNYYYMLDGTVLQCYMDVYLSIFISTRNGLFVGFPFLLLGVMMAYPNLLEKVNIKMVFFLTTCSLVMLLFEMNFIYEKSYNDDRSLFVSYAVLIPCIVVIGLLYNFRTKKSTSFVRNLSTCIYFSHSFFQNIIRNAVNIGEMEMFVLVILGSLTMYLLSSKIVILRKLF